MMLTFIRSNSVWLRLALLCLGFTAVGCTNSNMPPLYPVRGKVTLDGEPLGRAIIVLIPDKGPSCGGITNADGTYELVHRSGRKGAPAGRTKVFITTETQDENGNRTPERLPHKYNEATRLEFEIKAGDNEQDFDLRSK